MIHILFHTLESVHWDSQVPATLKRWSFQALTPRSPAQECRLLLLHNNLNKREGQIRVPLGGGGVEANLRIPSPQAVPAGLRAVATQVPPKLSAHTLHRLWNPSNLMTCGAQDATVPSLPSDSPPPEKSLLSLEKGTYAMLQNRSSIKKAPCKQRRQQQASRPRRRPFRVCICIRQTHLFYEGMKDGPQAPASRAC